MTIKNDALIIEAAHGFEDGAVVTRQDDSVVISVSQEKAVDSYNELFTCSVTMSVDQVRELYDWLGEFLGLPAKK